MASSNGGQPAPQRALVSMSGVKEDHTFTSYIEQRKDPQRRRHQVVMHPILLTPVRCWHCRWRLKNEGLLQPSKSSPDSEQVLDAAVDELALEGRSCFRCAQEICEKTRYLQDAVLEPVAGCRAGDTPLHQAAMSKNLTMFCHLITLMGEKGGHDLVVQALRKINDSEETALHMAVRVGDKDMVELMLWVDPQLGQVACHDTSPIYLAVSLGREDIAKALHDASGPSSIVSYSGPRGQNALHAAVLHGEVMTTKVLDWNKDLTNKQDEKGSTPLHFAVSVEQQCPWINLWIYRYKWLNHAPTWHLLDADSSMAYREDSAGLFPVHIAARTNQYDAIRILLRRCPGCMGLRDKLGRTFIHVAVQNKASKVVRAACHSEQCAPIMNIQDKNGNTALHLAVDVQSLSMVMALLRNRNVCLNLRNKDGQTALDIARRRKHEGFFFAENPDKVIYKTLLTLGATYGNHRWDHILENHIPHLKPKDADADADDKQATDKLLEKESDKMTSSTQTLGIANRISHLKPKDADADADDKQATDKLLEKESDKMTSSTQTLGIGLVLIATVTFGASFALPGGSRADDHPNGGSPTLAGRWYFDAFMMANTLAFICSSMALIGLMYSGMAMVSLPFRRVHFVITLFFVSSSVTSLTAAFALGVYMVLAPVTRWTAIAICAISPLVLLYRNTQGLWELLLVSESLFLRRGLRVWLWSTVGKIFSALAFELWPFAVIFGWAGYLKERHHG